MGDAMPSYTGASDTTNRIRVESHLIYAIWSQPYVHAGQHAAFEVRTSFVGNGAKIRITCFTGAGKKLDKMEGVVIGNRYRGQIIVPQKVKSGETVYFEAELPGHGLKGGSNLVSVRSAIAVSSIGWDRTEIRRGDVATLSCKFEDGVEDGDNAVVFIHEHNPNSCDFKVTSIPAGVKDGKVEIQWKFDYHDPVEQIPTEDEMKQYQKHYANPVFFFVVVVDNIRIGEKQESGLVRFIDRLSVSIKTEEGEPFPDAQCSAVLADGAVMNGHTDNNGIVEFVDIVPGMVRVSFPDLGRVFIEAGGKGTDNEKVGVLYDEIRCGTGQKLCVVEAPLHFSE